MNVQTFSHLRPKPDTSTGRVWEVADIVTAEKGRKAKRQEVKARYVAEGGNGNTASTQYYEWQKAYDQKGANFTGSTHTTSSEKLVLQIAPDGRLLIPLELRRLMKIGEDGKLTAQVLDGELRIISPTMAMKRLQDLIRSQDTGTGSVVDELIADRRHEAGRE